MAAVVVARPTTSLSVQATPKQVLLTLTYIFYSCFMDFLISILNVACITNSTCIIAVCLFRHMHNIHAHRKLDHTLNFCCVHYRKDYGLPCHNMEVFRCMHAGKLSSFTECHKTHIHASKFFSSECHEIHCTYTAAHKCDQS